MRSDPPSTRRPASGEHVGAAPKRRAIGSAVAWSSTGAIARQVLQTVTFIITSHILSPSEVGSAALALTVVAFGQMFTDLGLGAAIIHRRTIGPKLLSSAFWLGVGASVLIALVVAATSPLISAIFGRTSPPGLIALAALVCAVSFGTVSLSLLERSMRFRKIALIEGAATLIGSAVTISTASAGLGPTSLILGPIVTAATTTGLLLIRSGTYALTRPSIEEVKRILHFSWGLIAFNFTNYWSRNIDNLAVARVDTSAALGQYSRAYSLMLLPVNQIATVLARVLFPVLARAQDDRQQLQKIWLRAITVSMIVGFPVTAVACVEGRHVVELILGPQWALAGRLLTILSVTIPVQLIAKTLGPTLQAVGRTRLQFAVGAANSAILIGGVIIGAGWGVVGVTWGVAAAFIVNGLVVLAVIMNVTGTRATSFLHWTYAPLIALVLSVAAGGALRATVALGGVADMILVVGGIITAYLVSLAALERRHLWTLLSPVRHPDQRTRA